MSSTPGPNGILTDLGSALDFREFSIFSNALCCNAICDAQDQLPKLNTRVKRRAGRAPHDSAMGGDQRGAIVREKRFAALTPATGAAATATTGAAAENASAAGSAAVNDDFRGAGLSHGHRLSPNPL
jgi:hypothetical protein